MKLIRARRLRLKWRRIVNVWCGRVFVVADADPSRLQWLAVPIRLISALVAVLVFFVSSGAALYVHERLEHSAEFAAGSTADAMSAGVLPASTPNPADSHRPLPTHPHDCPVCSALLSFIALAAIALFLLAFADVVVRGPALAVARPRAVALRSPRSTRGPPLAIA